MARHPFPLNDLLIGAPDTGLRAGVPALLTHGAVIELFSDLACTTPLDARTADDSAAITSITVSGVTLPSFLGPDSEVVNVVYGRAEGVAGNGFPLYRADAFAGGGGTDQEIVRDTIAAALIAGSGVTITPNDAGDSITIAATGTTDPEVVRDTIAAALTGGTAITVTPNDAGDVIQLDVDPALATSPEVVQDTVAIALNTPGSGITVSYNDTTAKITIAVDPEFLRDTIASFVVAGANMTVTHDDTANTLTLASSGGGSTDAEVVRDTMAAALVAGTNVTITPNDAGDTITIAATDTNTTDPEVVRDTIAAALTAGSGITITPNDGADTIALAVTGRLLTKGNGTIDLTVPTTDSVATWRIVDDGTSTAGWIDRLVFRYQRTSGGASGWNTDHPTAWFNEYGELRVAPGRENTIPFRAFGADSPTAWTSRDKSVSLIEAVSDRTDRVNVWKVDGNGNSSQAGAVAATNVADRVETVPTGTTGFASMPDGTLWVEYTP